MNPAVAHALRTKLLAVLLSGAGALSPVATAAPMRLTRRNVFNWTNYIAPDTVANFEREKWA